MRGAFWAWLVFLAILGALVTLPGAVSAAFSELKAVFAIVSLAVGGAISGIATLVSLPFAALLGRSLARIRSRWIHLGAHAAFGAVVGGALAVGIGGAITGAWNMSGDLWPLIALAATAGAVSAGTGWSITARQALRDDRKVSAPWPERD
ncbi:MULTISPECIES: hypothetical protein [unclassified Microbacterium]|uniref:hypothetical protein n=1 Tax=unclassified Microbacterium TaxID=2609290 RepID=UPI00364861D1